MDSPSTFMNSPAAPTSTPKRSYASEHAPSPDTGEASENRRKDPKVSRACDACKVKKIRCSGDAAMRHMRQAETDMHVCKSIWPRQAADSASLECTAGIYAGEPARSGRSSEHH
ncbi:hypothetical protein GCM10020218_088880 [Dactylosporangium vinaceum]